MNLNTDKGASKREFMVEIYVNGVRLRRELTHDIRGNWALNQFTHAIQEEARRAQEMSDEDLETIKSFHLPPKGNPNETR